MSYLALTSHNLPCIILYYITFSFVTLTHLSLFLAYSLAYLITCSLLYIHSFILMVLQFFFIIFTLLYVIGLSVFQPRVWNGCGKNQESITELWIGLLRFYTEEFNIGEYVISIRQKEPLTKFEKLWNGSGISIEDPFNLDHNLGSALSRKSEICFLHFT